MAKQKLILTFDDGFVAQHKIALPILKSLNLTATFFICGAFIEHPTLTTFMGWEQVKDLVSSDFEIGSHLFNHFGMTDVNINHVANIKKLETRFRDFKIPKATTLSYPGYHVNEKAVKVVRSCGYRFARAGCEKTSKFADFQHGGKGSHYNYIYDSPYNINCTGIFGKNFGTDEFKKSLENISPGEIPVFCFHSFDGMGLEKVPETNISVKTFEQCMEFITENSFQTIKMCDIESSI